MPLTLREALAMPPFVDCSARVVAGARALGRPLRWVHCSEMPQAARLFRGEELLLTQGRGLSATEAEQCRWVDDLADAGVAGVGIEVGVAVDEIPRAVIDRAEERGLPVVELTHPAYFMAMTQAVHAVIVNSQYDALRRAGEVGRRFSRLALSGAGLQTILDHLASVVSRPVVLADSLHQVKAFSPDDASTVRRLVGWPAHARQRHRYADSHDEAEHVEAGGLRCVCQAIVFRGELWGSIHVLHDGDGLDELGMLALDRGVTSIGLAFATTEGELRQDDDARSALVQDLLMVGGVARPQVHERALALDVRLSGELRVAICQPIEPADPTQPRSGNTRELRSTLRAVSASTNRILKQSCPDVLVGYSGSRVVAVFGAPDSASVPGTAEQLAHGGSETQDRADLVVGVSGPSRVDTLPRAAAEAEDAVRYALRTGRGPGAIMAADLGIDRLLLKLDEGSTLSEHIERELGALLDHDARSGRSLLPTLVAYLEMSGNKTRIARSLHIERRSLYHRIERVRALVGGNLDDADTRLRLLVAVRGLAYRERSATSRGPGREV